MVKKMNKALQGLGLNPEEMFSLQDPASGEVLGWSESSPDLMEAMALKLLSRPGRFDELQVMGPGGEVLSTHRR